MSTYFVDCDGKVEGNVIQSFAGSTQKDIHGKENLGSYRPSVFLYSLHFLRMVALRRIKEHNHKENN